MPGPVSVGDEAPNFDLSSTEEALLMLKDEVVRTAIVVYFFADPASEQAHRDLDALNRGLDPLGQRRARVLAVSPAKLDDLKKLQIQRQLLFPLLHDDRNFSAAYGVAAPAEERPAAPALVVVDRRQRVLWMANPVATVEAALPQVLKALEGMPSGTETYEKSVINRWIDRWVN
jgi:peroxiredoxin